VLTAEWDLLECRCYIAPNGCMPVAWLHSAVEDDRMGYVPGLRLLPELEHSSPADVQAFINRAPKEKRVSEGILPGAWDVSTCGVALVPPRFRKCQRLP